MLRTPAPFIGALDVSGLRFVQGQSFGWDREGLRVRGAVQVYRAGSLDRRVLPRLKAQQSRCGCPCASVGARGQSSKRVLGRGLAQLSFKPRGPLGFIRAGSASGKVQSATESPYTLEFKCVAVRERAASGSGKRMQGVTLISNQAFERTLPRYALQRRSRHC